jgi:putative colanic acid biosynthesis acetyltransferase WcaF
MENNKLNLTKYHNVYDKKHQLIRLLWTLVWSLGTCFLPMSIGAGWKRFLLRLFGAHVDSTAIVYSKVKIFWPANLYMGKHVRIGANVTILNVAPIYFGEQSLVSDGAYLCSGSHDIRDPFFSQITSPIHIEAQAWIATQAFVGMGVTIGEGAVVGGRAAVFKDVEPWTVVGGNPAKKIGERKII